MFSIEDPVALAADKQDSVRGGRTGYSTTWISCIAMADGMKQSNCEGAYRRKASGVLRIKSCRSGWESLRIYEHHNGEPN